MNTIVKKTLTGTIAALTIGLSIAASSAPAEARWGRNAALFGGLAVGALAVGAIAHAHAAPRPVYYGGSCWTERRTVYNRYGDFVGYRGERVCN